MFTLLYMDLDPGIDCGRTFNEIAYSKHSKICRKVFIQKRKVFDSKKARARGTELENFQRQQGKLSSSRVGKAMKSIVSLIPQISFSQQPTWKSQSNSFRQAMRQARAYATAKELSKKTGAPLSALLAVSGDASSQDPIYSSYTQVYLSICFICTTLLIISFLKCPTCKRSFSDLAAQRHIPQCRNIINKPRRLYSHTGTSCTTTSASYQIAGGALPSPRAADMKKKLALGKRL